MSGSLHAVEVRLVCLPRSLWSLRLPLAVRTPRMPYIARAIETPVYGRWLEVLRRQGLHMVRVWVWVSWRELLARRRPTGVHGHLLHTWWTGWNEPRRKLAVCNLSGSERRR